jgi:hypothetical protein
MINNNMKHKHHIIPKHIGGTDDPSNLVELTIEEHAEAHRILFEQYGRVQDKRAWLGLAKIMTGKEIIDEILRSPKSEEMKRKLSVARKGKSNPWAIGNTNAAVLAGRPRSEETKKKISKSKTGKPRKDMIGNNYAVALKGRKKTDEHKKAVTAALNSLEVKDKISATWANRPIVQCPHCGCEGKQGHNMNRYHFNNCKRIK